jgi:hypothetical protein
MAITYPLALPSTAIRAISLTAVDVIGAGQSPFTLTEQFQQHAGQRWEADIELPPMVRADAEAWITFLLALKGRLGTFLLRDAVSGAPLGAWAGTPLVKGAHSAGASAVTVDGLTVATTIKAGDYIQFGSGASSRLHKVLIDTTANGSGEAVLDLWPNLREALSDNAAVVTSNAVGLFRLAANSRSWDIGLAQIYGLRFAAVEAL